MKTHRITTTGCLLAVLLLLCTSCGQSGEESNGDSSDVSSSGDTTAWTEPTYIFPSGPEDGDMSVCLSHWFRSIKELYEEADFVVIGRVFLRESPVSSDSHFSYLQIWVDEVLLGDMQSDQMITIREIGYYGSDGYTASICHVPLLQEGERVLLFLDGPWEYPDPWKTGYSLVGDYQGKFFYKQENDSWYAAGLLGKEGILVPTDAQQPLPDADFRMKLANMGTSQAVAE